MRIANPSLGPTPRRAVGAPDADGSGEAANREGIFRALRLVVPLLAIVCCAIFIGCSIALTGNDLQSQIRCPDETLGCGDLGLVLWPVVFVVGGVGLVSSLVYTVWSMFWRGARRVIGVIVVVVLAGTVALFTAGSDIVEGVLRGVIGSG